MENVASYIAKTINPQKHNFIDQQKTQNSQSFQMYRNNLKTILAYLENASYLYTVSYHPESGEFTYTIDAEQMDHNTIWIESNSFALSLYKKDWKLNIDYDGSEWIDKNFSIKKNWETFNIQMINDIPNKLLINWDEILEITNSELFTTKTPSWKLSPTNIELEEPIILNRTNTKIYLSLSPKGTSASNPGVAYIDTQEAIKVMKEWLNKWEAFSTNLMETSYGTMITSYGIIKNALQIPIGLVSIDSTQENINNLKWKNFWLYFLLYICTCGISIGTLYITLFHRRKAYNYIEDLEKRF